MTSPLLLLASTSGSRRAVLDATGFDYLTDSPDVDERALITSLRQDGQVISPRDEAGILARAKAADVAARPTSRGHLILGCDSVFELDGKAYGKPHLPEVAIERWKQMRGRTGVLHSGHTLIDTRNAEAAVDALDPMVSRTVSTRVTFAEATDSEIEAYVATGEPLGCAGAFTVDGRAASLVTGIEGDFHSVIGVSPSTVRQLCSEFAVPVTELWRPAS